MAQLVECKTLGRIIASSRLTGSFCVIHSGKSVTIPESNNASDVYNLSGALCVVLCIKKLHSVSRNWRMEN